MLFLAGVTLQELRKLVCSLFKALRVLPTASSCDSISLMDINTLLALVEDLICPQNVAGQGLREEAEKPFAFGSVQVKGKSLIFWNCSRARWKQDMLVLLGGQEAVLGSPSLASAWPIHHQPLSIPCTLNFSLLY